MFWYPLTWGAGGAVQAADPTAQWVWQADLTRVRVYRKRVRDGYWVEHGHIETDNPDTDSREG